MMLIKSFGQSGSLRVNISEQPPVKSTMASAVEPPFKA
jgi:hypothetical protein